MKITSLTNPRIKKLVRLRERRNRLKIGLTIIDGLREVSLAQKGHIRLENIFFCPELVKSQEDMKKVHQILGSKTAFYEVTKKVFEKISFGNRMDGLLAVGKPGSAEINTIKVTKNSIFVILENIEKPGNLGAVLRTCDGVGVDGLIIAGEKCDIYNPNVIRSSLGTIFNIPVYQDSLQNVVAMFKKKNVKLWASSPNADKIYSQVKYCSPCAIILGNEHQGLSPYALHQSDALIKIPMKGVADSLNVSVTAAVLLYEINRQNG